MRRGLVALLALLGASSIASAQVRFVPPPGSTSQAGAAAKVSPDEVVTRLMTFDHNNDGRVAIGELSERMRPLVARGDKNGDEALDRAEIQALAVAPPAPVQTQRLFAAQGGYSFGDEAGLSSKTHIEGALEDLRLAAEKKERALPIVRAYVDQLEKGAKADLLARMEPLLSSQQFQALTTAVNNQQREIQLRTNAGGVEATRVLRLMVGDLTRSLDAMGVFSFGQNTEEARKAIDDFKLRVRLGRESDRSELLAQLKDVLGDEERDDYGAALARRPVVASGPQFVAFNDVRAREFINVVKPAVLIEQQTPVTIIAR